ncbi:hypothetical protein [Arthrobacter sp. SAFR-023]|uniref:hypothetical protein n=1 Tax=Arthrobacter sp. SAFR-023 TaxID=3436866 RepID=UPI003F7BEDBC
MLLPPPVRGQRRDLQPWIGLGEAGAPDDVATGRLRPSSSINSPCRTPATRGTNWTPAARRSAALVRISGLPMPASLGSTLRPTGMPVFSTCIPAKRTIGMRNQAAVRPCRNGISPVALPASHVS